MAAEPSAQDFHKQAKDAGNKLRAYILSYSSAATGVFFLALTGRDLPGPMPDPEPVDVAPTTVIDQGAS